MTTFSIISLGCPKNLVDSETMVGRLRAAGLSFRDEERCDAIILNTCGFLQSARSEARDVLRELVQNKRNGIVKKIVVTGCMVKHEGNTDNASKLVTEFPEVDAWVGVFDETAIVETITSLFTKKTKLPTSLPIIQLTTDQPKLELDDTLRTPFTAAHFAYLKIADGCNRACSFCAIPSIRGRFVSKPFDAVVDEAKRLADSGVKEISLIAQETTYYGVDLYGKPTLSKLIDRLEQIDGIEWIRLMYTYPLLFDDDLIARFGTSGKLLPYLDIPLQHCNNEILSQMKRVVTREQTEKLLQRLRESCNDLVLRTSLIVGFPGETDAVFNELVDFVKKWKFERAGIFKFSLEEGTAAAKLDNKVPQKVINQRYSELVKIQQNLTKRYAKQQIGKEIAVIIDAPFEEANGKKVTGCFIGRAKSDAPDIDPYIIVNGQTEAGKIEKCEVVEVSGNNLVAVI